MPDTIKKIYQGLTQGSDTTAGSRTLWTNDANTSQVIRTIHAEVQGAATPELHINDQNVLTLNESGSYSGIEVVDKSEAVKVVYPTGTFPEFLSSTDIIFFDNDTITEYPVSLIFSGSAQDSIDTIQSINVGTTRSLGTGVLANNTSSDNPQQYGRTANSEALFSTGIDNNASRGLYRTDGVDDLSTAAEKTASYDTGAISRYWAVVIDTSAYRLHAADLLNNDTTTVANSLPGDNPGLTDFQSPAGSYPTLAITEEPEPRVFWQDRSTSPGQLWIPNRDYNGSFQAFPLTGSADIVQTWLSKLVTGDTDSDLYLLNIKGSAPTELNVGKITNAAQGDVTAPVYTDIGDIAASTIDSSAIEIGNIAPIGANYFLVTVITSGVNKLYLGNLSSGTLGGITFTFIADETQIPGMAGGMAYRMMVEDIPIAPGNAEGTSQGSQVQLRITGVEQT